MDLFLLLNPAETTENDGNEKLKSKKHSLSNSDEIYDIVDLSDHSHELDIDEEEETPIVMVSRCLRITFKAN